MITRDNLKAVFNSLTLEEVEAAMDSDGDYVVLELHSFNAGFFATLEAMDYSEEKEEEISGEGNVFCDKNTLLQLFGESESLNPAFNDYI